MFSEDLEIDRLKERGDVMKRSQRGCYLTCALVFTLVLVMTGCARPPSDTDLDTRPLSPSCRELLRAQGESMRMADSLLAARAALKASSRYESLLEVYYDCALLHTRHGDALLAADRREAARAAYTRALELDACAIDAWLGSARLRRPLVGGITPPLLGVEESLHRALGCDPGSGPALELLWQLQIQKGDTDAAEDTIYQLSISDHYPQAARDYGRNIIEGARDGGIIFTSGGLETDLCLAATRHRPRDIFIVDLTMSERPWYVRYLNDIGLPLDMSDSDVNRLAPYWSSTRKRTVTVSEQVVDRIIETNTRADRRVYPVYFTSTATHPAAYARTDRLSLTGLLMRLEEPGTGGASPAEIIGALDEYKTKSLNDRGARWPRGAHPTVRSECHRLLSAYPRVALKGSVAAFRNDDRPRALQLLKRAQELADGVWVSEGIRKQLRDLETYASEKAAPPG